MRVWGVCAAANLYAVVSSVQQLAPGVTGSPRARSCTMALDGRAGDELPWPPPPPSMPPAGIGMLLEVRGGVPGSSKHVDGEDGRGENRGADDQDGRQRDG